MKITARSLIIEALAYKKNKSYGYQEYLFNLLTYFFENRDRIKYDKIIIVCNKSEYDDFIKFKSSFMIRGYHFDTILSRFIVQLFLPFLLRIKKNDTILYTANYSSFIKKSKQILVIHDLLYLRAKLLPKYHVRIQRRIYLPMSIAISDVVIAISDFTKNDLFNNFKINDKHKVVRVYNYFNFEKYSYQKGNILSKPHHEYFLCISSSAYHKNIITVLKAFEKYCYIDHKTHLYLVGSINGGDSLLFYNQLEKNVKIRIHLCSHLTNNDLASLYSYCKAYLSASYFEGLGMPVVEAMFFNVPLILSNLDIYHEITGNNAIFFDPYSYEDLLKVLINFNHIKLNTRSYVLERYSSEKTSQKYIDILNSL